MKISTIIADIIMIANRDHGDLQGLTGDDHAQYHNNTRGDVRYYTKTLLNAGQLNNLYYTEAELNSFLGVKVQIGGDLGGTVSAPTVTGLTIPSEAEGDLFNRGASVWVRLPIGANNTYLQVDTGVAGKVKWGVSPAVNFVEIAPNTRIVNNVDTWTDYDYSGYLPAGARVAVFNMWIPGSTATFGIRKAGSSVNREIINNTAQTVYVMNVSVVDSKHIEMKQTDASDARFILTGYFI